MRWFTNMYVYRSVSDCGRGVPPLRERDTDPEVNLPSKIYSGVFAGV